MKHPQCRNRHFQCLDGLFHSCYKIHDAVFTECHEIRHLLSFRIRVLHHHVPRDWWAHYRFYCSIEVPQVQYIDRIVHVTVSVALLFLCEI